jgi:sugar lactone lactonase YvrE
MQIEKVPAAPDALGECPVWDGEARRLYWVDIVAGRVRSFEPPSGRERSWTVPAPVAAVGLTTGEALLIALQHGFHRLDLASGAVTPVAALPTADPAARLNDGKMDRQGRFVCGGMGLKAEPVGELFRLSAPGRIETLKGGIRISNCVAFSPAGDVMYFADSLSRKIEAYPYDPDGEGVGPPRVVIDAREIGAIPDGATVDAEGQLWVALTNKGQVARISPAGEVTMVIDLPVEFPTCPAFGGEALDVLYVTSIRDSGTGRSVSQHPDGGCVFAISGLGVRGLAEARFAL